MKVPSDSISVRPMLLLDVVAKVKDVVATPLIEVVAKKPLSTLPVPHER